MSLALLKTTDKVPRRCCNSPGRDTWKDIQMCADSNSGSSDKAEAYAALIKPGDAVETPDGELWVVSHVTEDAISVVSAYRGQDGRIYADPYEATYTSLPRELVTKVADARQVRR